MTKFKLPNFQLMIGSTNKRIFLSFFLAHFHSFQYVAKFGWIIFLPLWLYHKILQLNLATAQLGLGQSPFNLLINVYKHFFSLCGLVLESYHDFYAKSLLGCSQLMMQHFYWKMKLLLKKHFATLLHRFCWILLKISFEKLSSFFYY
jgi:hypothetical protein